MLAQIRVQRLRDRRAGQTLIIAILVLGVLLILGIAFAGIINRNITETGRSAQRTVASDLSQAGVNFAHEQMLYSVLGADWRPQETLPDVDVAGNSKDPDALYLRPGTGFLVEIDPVGRPGYTVFDRGGPDYLGAYSRIGFARGRSLVRVRYAPSAYDAFGAQTGALRQPGQARGHLVIESVGRSGALDDQGKVDPSRLLPRSVQVTGFADGNALRDGLGAIKAADASVTNSRRLVAFASIGLLESARFIGNKNKETRPIEVGFPVVNTGSTLWSQNVNVGVSYEGASVAVPQQFGANASGAVNVPVNQGRWDLLPGGGSLFANGEVLVHGVNEVFLNRSLGESWIASGGIRPANNISSLTFQNFNLNAPATSWVNTLGALTLTGNQLDSRNGQFRTLGGALRDGRDAVDVNGFQRGVARKEPPSITITDPQNGLNRYRELTRRTGPLTVNGLTIGEFGYGEGVYVASDERGNRKTADQRKALDPLKTLPNDWLNPNNGATQGWQGPYYVPIAPHVRFLADGFEIRLDGRSANKFWKDPRTGADTSRTSCRFYVREVAGKTYIVNDITNAGFDPNTGDWVGNGQEFNGVLMFEGDVRVRGVIPTDVQLSLVSMGTIYIDGSIVKGTFDPWTDITLTRPSRSMLALLARDYVAVNTTQFFAPAVGQAIQAKTVDPLPNTPNPIELQTSQDVTLETQFLLSPTGNNPALWTPASLQYTTANTNAPLSTYMLMTVSADDNGPSFFSMDLLTGTFQDLAPTSTRYQWETYVSYGIGAALTLESRNGAASLFGAPLPDNIPLYGLADPTINSYPKFETFAMPIVDRALAGNFQAYSSAVRKIRANAANPNGQYELSVQDPNFFRLAIDPAGNAATKNGLIAKTAITPFDIRIEAVMYAENGSFFVIPGTWFNQNVEDTRAAFVESYTPGDTSDDLNAAALDYDAGATTTLNGNTVNRLVLAQSRRFERYGNSPEVPFYAEPMAVRISIVGSVSENMPAPMSQQAEWLKKWGWMPRRIGGTGLLLPAQHVPTGYNVAGNPAVPNLSINYDPILATAAIPVTAAPTSDLAAVRTDAAGRILPPAPRLPVSPTLAYFGDSNP